MASISDGSSNTFLAGELHIPRDQINKQPYNGAIFNGEDVAAYSRVGGPGVPLLPPNMESGPVFGFGSWHPGVCNFVMADGSTHAVALTLDTILLGDLCHRSDGNVASLDQ